MIEPIKVIMVGGGGHYRACVDIISRLDNVEIVGVVDNKHLSQEETLGYKYLGNDGDLPTLIEEYKNVFISIGQIKSSAIRKKIKSECESYGASFPSFVSPLAIVSKWTKIGQGVIVMHNCVVNPNSVIGDFSIINTKSLVEHDVLVGEFTHISTGAILNGEAKIGSDTFVGSGAIVFQQREIGDEAIIGAGTIVKKNVLAKEVVI